MSNLLDKLNKEIEINTNHIENYPLETDKGTKKVKLNFHKNAVIQRNKYISKEIEKFNEYKRCVYQELNERVEDLLPANKRNFYDTQVEDLQRLEELVILNNENMNSSTKLNLDFLVSKINGSISLNELNNLLKSIINIFKKNNVMLTIEDFKYSLFVEKYMQVFLNNIDDIYLPEKTKRIFEETYYECPDIIDQMKLNLKFIIKKYEKQLNEGVLLKLEKSLKIQSLDKSEIVKAYLQKRTLLDDLLSKDEYNNLKMFLKKEKNIAEYLDNSPSRIKNFNQFAINGNFSELDDLSKEKYYEAVIDLSNVLEELKEYYRYEEIIKDLIVKFKERINNINNYKNKEKELSKEEKNREKLLKKYLKTQGIGLFAKKNKNKEKVLKMQINEQFKKLTTLYDELDNLKVYVDLNKKLNDASSIYNLFVSSFLDFSYLKKQFDNKFSEEEDYNFEKEFQRYFRFLYNPFNDFLRKISGLSEYNIAEIIAEKYKLLGLSLNTEDVTVDKIDQTITTAKYIKLILDIETSKLKINNIYFICNYKFLDIDEELQEISKKSILNDEEVI